MVRNEFLKLLTSNGIATLKEVRALTLNKTPDVVTEFEILNFPNFDDSAFGKMCAEKFGLSYIDLSNAKVSKDIIGKLPKKSVLKYRSIPIQVSQTKITLATFDPTVIADSKVPIENEVKLGVEFILTSISSWQKLFLKVEDSIEDLIKSIVEVKGGDDLLEDVKAEDIGQDVVAFVNRILAESFVKGTSDIHIEPYEKSFRVRFRLDGSLVEVARPPKSIMLPVISRLKIMSQLDISEKRKPQDGRIKLMVGGKPIDFRVSSLPTLFGEKIVLRLLDQSNLQLDMTKLGFEQKQLEVFKKGIHNPYGMVLVTGPTGSGKTTTLYSALADLNTVDTNISTAEDPCEFNLEGINQVNVKKEVGLTFASALKAFLRQDPDIIMVGEIRDLAVGEIAVEAALTGHMVLSTLHTNDACSTITRLLNMGIEPFLVVAALNCIVAQRLCRKICLSCRKQVSIPVEQLIAAGFAPSSAEKVKTFKGAGCDACGGKGYKGRVAIYEVLAMSAKVRELILQNASTDELKAQAIKDGMKSLRMSALTKVAQGQTTLEEATGNSASDSD
jgi:type IV pilus assembly protein PilB